MSLVPAHILCEVFGFLELNFDQNDDHTFEGDQQPDATVADDGAPWRYPLVCRRWNAAFWSQQFWASQTLELDLPFARAMRTAASPRLREFGVRRVNVFLGALRPIALAASRARERRMGDDDDDEEASPSSACSKSRASASPTSTCGPVPPRGSCRAGITKAASADSKTSIYLSTPSRRRPRNRVRKSSPLNDRARWPRSLSSGCGTAVAAACSRAGSGLKATGEAQIMIIMLMTISIVLMMMMMMKLM
eukprot:Selendium_serpulae@DN5875_c0_g1_i5.p1